MRCRGWKCDGCGKTDNGQFGFPFEWFKAELVVEAPHPNLSFPPASGTPDRRTKVKIELCSMPCFGLWAAANCDSVVKRTRRSS